MKLKPAIVLLLLCGCFIISCNQFNIGHAGDKYYYYPGKNVYYDIKRSNFLYSLDSGKTWDSMYAETANPAIDGKRETVYNTSGAVWKDNKAHRQLYHGFLLNIINEESLNADASSKKNVGASASKAVNETGKKERKRPIKRFFQKLFGKKKQDDIN